MKRLLIIISAGIALALGILIFASIYQPAINIAGEITPTPELVTPAPTPSPTPEVKVEENIVTETIQYSGFHTLLNIMTASQYNYVMHSIDELYNQLYQANIRHYSFAQFRGQNDDFLHDRFYFASDEEMMVPFNKYTEGFIDDEQEYLLIMDEDSVSVETDAYKFTASFYVNGDKTADFQFTIRKNTLEMKIQ